MTKQGRIVGGISSILGGIYLIILSSLYARVSFLIFNLIFAVLGILGGILLINDWKLGGGLSLGGATMLFCAFFSELFSTSDIQGAFPYFIGAGLIGIGGFIGLLIGSESPLRISSPELELIDDWIEMNITEIIKTYNVEKIKFFDLLWGGLVFLTEFSKNISPESIKNLIVLLERNWNRKVFIMTRAGLDDTELTRDNYIIYQKEGGHLNYKIEQIQLND